MLTIVTTFFKGGSASIPASSRIFTPEWADKLYRGCRRHFQGELRFVVATDEPRSSFKEDVEVMGFLNFRHDWWAIMEGLRLIGDPVMQMGLDTIITGPLEDFEEVDAELAMIRDPFNTKKLANGVVMWRGNRGAELYDQFVADPDRKSRDFRLGGRNSEMIWLAKKGNPDAILEDLFPNRILSYKAHVRPNDDDIGDAAIVYFHGDPKPHQIMDVPFVREYWR